MNENFRYSLMFHQIFRIKSKQIDFIRNIFNLLRDFSEYLKNIFCHVTR